MSALPVSTEPEPFESGQEDYFAFDETFTVELPDGKSFVECKALNEGGRRKYLAAVNRDVRLQRATQDVIMKMSPGEERQALLMESIVGWNLVSKGRPISCTDANKRSFLDKANPKLLDTIEMEVRKHNSWLQADMTVEDLQKEIDRLTELRDQKIADEEGKVS